jgi:hypothetical protein
MNARVVERDDLTVLTHQALDGRRFTPAALFVRGSGEQARPEAATCKIFSKRLAHL